MTDLYKRISRKKSLLKASAATIIASSLLLSGCGSTPDKQAGNDNTQSELNLADLQAFLDKAATLPPQERVDKQLQAAAFLIRKGESDWAHQLVDTINTSTLSQEQLAQLMLVRAKIAIFEGEPYLAQHYLFHPQLEQSLAFASDNTVLELLDLRATLMFNIGEYLRAVDARITIASRIVDDEMQSQLNHDLLWEALAELATHDLFALAKSEKNKLKQGWYSLAALSKSNGANFRQQIIDINKWRDIWPEHPANGLLPADLQLILQLADEQAQNIAVLLPFSGKLSAASKAIKDGLMAAYYDDASVSSQVPSLRFYDTHNADINALYDQAVDEGAELIIGPLNKDNVTLLSKRPVLQLPTLALNNIVEEKALNNVQAQLVINDEVPPLEQAATQEVDTEAELEQLPETRPTAHENLYQFGLAIESEARQVAQKAWRDGHRSVLIIAPKNGWGDRGVNAFNDEWEALGGTLTDDRRYMDQRSYSGLVESSVAVDQSKARYKEIRRIVGGKLEFEPRRRKDIDFVFLLSNSSQGKQLKPLLAFHYAGDVPVYATSQIYMGKDGKGLSDLNGVKFSTLPWYFDNALGEKRAINAYASNLPHLQSLYAMGIDAYHIYPRLKQLKKISQARFYGSTGKLRVDHDNRIAREQSWAEIQAGKAVELNQKQ